MPNQQNNPAGPVNLDQDTPDGWIYPEQLGGEVRLRESVGTNGFELPDGTALIIERRKDGRWKRVSNEEAQEIVSTLQSEQPQPIEPPAQQVM